MFPPPAGNSGAPVENQTEVRQLSASTGRHRSQSVFIAGEECRSMTVLILHRLFLPSLPISYTDWFLPYLPALPPCATSLLTSIIYHYRIPCLIIPSALLSPFSSFSSEYCMIAVVLISLYFFLFIFPRVIYIFPLHLMQPYLTVFLLISPVLAPSIPLPPSPLVYVSPYLHSHLLRHPPPLPPSPAGLTAGSRARLSHQYISNTPAVRG